MYSSWESVRFDEEPAVDEESCGWHAEAAQFGEGLLRECRVVDSDGAYRDRDASRAR
ncbi:hypothetical protein [Burkholderia ambifaria]|uniref:hypothetical protein n=1 Tax=Burkholderia ambifaria TaxID=152480 RepID=UPI0012FDED17|nr:hypothetical protein [Burkholderia ambifaria]